MVLVLYPRERAHKPLSHRKWNNLALALVCATCVFILIPKGNFYDVTFHVRHITSITMTSDLSADDLRLKQFNSLTFEPEQLDYNLENPSKFDFSRGQSKIIDELLGRKEEGFFLDLGAGDGETNSVSLFFERHRHWNGVLLEGDEDTFRRLLAKNRRAICWNFRLRFDSGPDPPQDLEVYPRDVFRLINRTFIDLLVINLREHELHILQSIDFDRYTIDVISVELETSRSREEYPQLVSFLAGHGYGVVHLLIDTAAGKKDVVFRKA
ncbi:uncharacterized protein LOC131930247 [Physella acuta]|uniref:uncharacterized protein LOC131930247 n=1 Tax=Physella acuta TaxID=109671 RepID=UPI0027DD071B|nr:uncharacterized protein LOC131930247 [Physella acuta]